ncbi:hypothetical protein JCM1840_006950 [Sporobolomyces johnsonii]
MPPPSSFAQLKSLKRLELQALAKDNDIKANGTTVVLISSLAQLYGFASEDPPAAPPAKSLAPSTKPKRSVAAASKPKATRTTKKAAPSVDAAAEEASPAPTPALGAPIGANIPTNGDATAGSSSAKETVNQEVSAQEASAPRIVYRTSPETLATIDSLVSTVNALSSLLSTVNALRAELTTAQSTINDLKATVSELSAAQASRAPSLTEVDIRALVKHQFAELQPKLQGPSTQVTELGAGTEGVTETTNSKAKVVEHLDAQAEVATSAQEGTEDAIEHCRTSFSSGPVVADASQEVNTTAAASSPRSQPAVDLASPTPSDAPPIQTLGSYSAPATPDQSTPLRASHIPAASHSPSPLKLASALPSHMVAHAVSEARRTPHASTSTASSVADPASPALVSNLGKHRRDSEASNVSIDVERVTVTGSSRTGTTAPRGSFPSSLRSTMDTDGHSRKKLKVSWDDEQRADDDEEPVDSLSKEDDEKEQGSLEDDSEDDSIARPFPFPQRPATTTSSGILTPSAFANSSNRYAGGGIFSNSTSPPKSASKLTKVAAPPTPMAPRTLFGTERALSSFADEGVASPYRRY